jgi:hypothetical protein
MCIRIFNKLPAHIANLVGSKKTFISALRKYLADKSLYSVEEFLNESFSQKNKLGVIIFN